MVAGAALAALPAAGKAVSTGVNLISKLFSGKKKKGQQQQQQGMQNPMQQQQKMGGGGGGIGVPGSRLLNTQA